MEIAKAHDILDELLNNPELNKAIDWSDNIEHRSNIIAVKRTLCWILGHDEGRWFQDNLDNLNNAVKKLGFELKQTQ
jgi:hypothetical protein